MGKSTNLLPVHDPAELWFFHLRFSLELLVCSEEDLYSMGPWGHRQKKGARLFPGVVWLREVPQDRLLVEPPSGEPPTLAAGVGGAGGLSWELSPVLVLAHTPPLVAGRGGWLENDSKPCVRTLENSSGMQMSSCDWVLAECERGPSYIWSSVVCLNQRTPNK